MPECTTGPFKMYSPVNWLYLWRVCRVDRVCYIVPGKQAFKSTVCEPCLIDVRWSNISVVPPIYYLWAESQSALLWLILRVSVGLKLQSCGSFMSPRPSKCCYRTYPLLATCCSAWNLPHYFTMRPWLSDCSRNPTTSDLNMIIQNSQ